MSEKKTGGYAPINKRVILPALLAIVLLAAGVCALHWENAVSLRGTAKLSEYTWLETTGETLNLPTEHGGKRLHALYEDGNGTFALYVCDPWTDGGVMHIEGTLLRIDQTVGEVNVRVGLIPERPREGAGEDAQDEAILLNTQLVRRHEYASAYGYDDHCGFKATVETERLLGEGWQYRVVLADGTDGAMRMFKTDMTVKPIEGGLASARMNQSEEEAQHAQ